MLIYIIILVSISCILVYNLTPNYKEQVLIQLKSQQQKPEIESKQEQTQLCFNSCFLSSVNLKRYMKQDASTTISRNE